MASDLYRVYRVVCQFRSDSVIDTLVSDVAQVQQRRLLTRGPISLLSKNQE